MRLGFIGLGNIGSQIATALCTPHTQVQVFDVLPSATQRLTEAGAIAAASPQAVAEGSDFVGVCVQDEEQVLEVLDGDGGLLAGARPGLLVLVHSTISLGALNALAARAARAGVQMIDAPVSRASTPPTGIVFMVGGAAEAVAGARPYLELCALKVIETGALGTAMTLKICNNMLTYLQACGARDVLNLATAAGLEIDHLISLTATNGIGSPSVLRTLERRGRAFVHTEASPAVEIERMGRISEKDLDCALETGRDLGVELPSAVMARAAIRKAIAAGFDGP